MRLKGRLTIIHGQSENRISEQRTFDVKPSNLGYESEHGKKIGRNCDIYVFCLNTGRTRETANPMDVSTWEFYVAATSYLDQILTPTQKSVTLNKIRKLAGVKMVSYDGIKDEIDRLIKSGEAQAHNYSDDGKEFHFEV